MAKAKSTISAKAPVVSTKILERLGALTDRIHDAYCMAACIGCALLYKESDMDPEIAVCVSKYLVLPLNAASYEAADIKAALERPRKRSASEKAKESTDPSTVQEDV